MARTACVLLLVLGLAAVVVAPRFVEASPCHPQVSAASSLKPHVDLAARVADAALRVLTHLSQLTGRLLDGRGVDDSWGSSLRDAIEDLRACLTEVSRIAGGAGGERR